MPALGEETTVHAVVGSIVWAFRRLKKPRSREMIARGYALHSVCHHISFHPKNNEREKGRQTDGDGDLSDINVRFVSRKQALNQAATVDTHKPQRK